MTGLQTAQLGQLSTSLLIVDAVLSSSPACVGECWHHQGIFGCRKGSKRHQCTWLTHDMCNESSCGSITKKELGPASPNDMVVSKQVQQHNNVKLMSLRRRHTQHSGMFHKTHAKLLPTFWTMKFRIRSHDFNHHIIIRPFPSQPAASSTNAPVGPPDWCNTPDLARRNCRFSTSG